MSAAHCLFSHDIGTPASARASHAVEVLPLSGRGRRRGIAGSRWAVTGAGHPRLPVLHRDRIWPAGLRWAGHALDHCAEAFFAETSALLVTLRHNRGGFLEVGVLDVMERGGATQRTRLLPVDPRTAEGWLRTLAAGRPLILVRDSSTVTGRVVNALRDCCIEQLTREELVAWQRAHLSLACVEICPDSLRARLAREAAGGHAAALLELEELHLADLRSLLVRRVRGSSKSAQRAR